MYIHSPNSEHKVAPQWEPMFLQAKFSPEQKNQFVANMTRFISTRYAHMINRYIQILKEQRRRDNDR